ncbi:hypothetical protein JGI14_100644 [Candidatus Kryptonium thompsonii]|uniref:Uncharacterized protein n=1 Tax=Candidatus Kryptonium thompsonii TaxID=1633631 RepID=A0A0P1MVS2_9BACT|nr:hypothetical protein [Candidatus Kryptonium thompsoni]CUS76880.1 hypothetical protein JGI13_00075 [Candidatus Kryptonium thompsoni]CUS77116.1 hypothetical protein JGI10_00095 [Candidatus Kryptonium thompsoni]CUS79227.1 hypothetical protein JGI15_100524 [Candidatus Kryptonium thompsoni]CUS79703.1 hypothetical protein JGI14_100644 [Candidatus Kryptonium thompsoni]CUS82580.1 hypothetical protein JGI16_104812 [Candidatus Kryptonium thompsoni]
MRALILSLGFVGILISIFVLMRRRKRFVKSFETETDEIQFELYAQ